MSFCFFLTFFTFVFMGGEWGRVGRQTPCLSEARIVIQGISWYSSHRDDFKDTFIHFASFGCRETGELI